MMLPKDIKPLPVLIRDEKQALRERDQYQTERSRGMRDAIAGKYPPAIPSRAYREGYQRVLDQITNNLREVQKQ